MPGIFDDNPPSNFKRSARGWIKPKPTATKKQLQGLKSENLELKDRLAQVEAMVEQLVSKKKK